MLVLLHVLVALGSVAYTTYLLVAPSRLKLKISYGLVAATLASGTYLIWSTRSHLLQACAMGLVYLAVVSYGIVSARHKLTSVNVRSETEL